MNLFSRKKPPPPPPPATVPTPKEIRSPKTETILKLDLPDVFAFQQDVTKVAMPTRSLPGAVEEGTAKVGRGTIVLVESDDEVRRLLSRLFQYEGFHLLTVSCLAEARALLKEQPVDFVLARRACVPANLQTEIALREVRKKASTRIVDEFSDLILGQVVDYESLAQCTLGLNGLFLSLLEGPKAGARGHAHTVAKYCRLVGQRLGMKRRDLDALTLTATLHDLGALETNQHISEPVFGANEFTSPSPQPTLDLLANIAFPYPVNDLLEAVPQNSSDPDAVDADGLPPVPLGARILRVVDTYDTLRRTRADQFATEGALFEWFRRQPAGTFDTDALETLIHIRRHERTISAMNLFSAGILFVDPHLEDLQVLKLRLENDDYQVLTAKTTEEALHQLRTQPINVVVTEYALDRPAGGLELLRAIKGDPALRHLPVILHAAPNTDLTRQALELGAEDWYPKPHNVEITALKLQRIIGRAAANPAASEGAQGSLREIGLIEMVQLLCQGGRSVHLQLEHDANRGELAIAKGQLIVARQGSLTGDDAVRELLRWRDGQFRLRPLKDVPPANVTGSTDALLSEGCRLDHTQRTVFREEKR